MVEIIYMNSEHCKIATYILKWRK